VTELRSADEVFITSTAGGIMAATRIDGALVAEGKIGPITRTLYRPLLEKARGPSLVSRRSLTPIEATEFFRPLRHLQRLRPIRRREGGVEIG
jgi:hypothetical protein